ATTPIEVADRVLSTSEPEAGNRIVEVFDAEGITVATAARAEAVSHHNNRFRVRLGSGTTIEAERFLVATGRSCDLATWESRHSVWTTRKTASRSTATYARANASGQSGTSRAPEHSPTPRCTKPPSRSTTSSAGRAN